MPSSLRRCIALLVLVANLLPTGPLLALLPLPADSIRAEVSRYAYAALGRQTKRILPDGAEERFTYDAAGERTTRTDFAGRVTSYAYDVAGRMTRRTYPDGTYHAFGYTATGKRQSMSDARGTTSYAHDARDRVTTLVEPDGRELRFGYDLGGNRTRLEAHVAGQTLVTSFTYDLLSRLETVTDPDGKVSVHGYDANGNRSQLTQPNGVTTSYAYDRRNRLTSLASTHAVSGTIGSYAYTLTPTGNRTRIVESDGTTRSYGYDALERLTDEHVTAGSAPDSPTRWRNAFTYDAVGNRLHQEKTIGTGSPLPLAYTYDPRDRLLTENELTYGWDANGNQTSKSGPDGATYTWDYENRLTRVALANGTLVEHTYDADGTRVRTRTTPATGPPTTIDYLVDPWHQTSAAGRSSLVLSQVVAETDASGQLTAYHVRGDDLLATLRPNPTAPTGGSAWIARYFHAEGIGTIRTLTDEQGQVTDRYALEAFGTLLSHEGADPNAYLFAGEPLDPNSSFYYNRARWLEPSSGRFVGPDLLSGFASQPSSLHKYLYGGGRPTNSSDPTGLSEFSLAGQLTSIAARASLAAQSSFAALRIAFAQGDGGAIGRLFRELGLRAQGFAEEVFSLFPRLNVQAGQRGVQVGRQFIDFLLRAGNRLAYVEGKYALPRNWGTSLDRLVRQVNESLAAIAELPAGLEGRAVVWTYAEPTLRQLRLVQTALGPNASRVQFVNGLEGLYQWVTLYFQGLL